MGRISLTISLRNALQDLRDCDHFEHPKTFWIDQLCINQTDDVEKSDQVAQMMRMYGAARETVTYLGPGEPENKGALLVLNTIYSHYKMKAIGNTSNPDSQHVSAILRAMLANPLNSLRRTVLSDEPFKLDIWTSKLTSVSWIEIATPICLTRLYSPHLGTKGCG